MCRSSWFCLVTLATLISSPCLGSSELDSGRIADEFSAGVLGFTWGTDLEIVARAFPTGTAWPAVSYGRDIAVERYYAVADDMPILGVSRERQHTLFGFDRSNRFVQAIFAMPYSSENELRSRATAAFGASHGFRIVGLQRHTFWERDNGIEFLIIEIPHDTRPSLFVKVTRYAKAFE